MLYVSILAPSIFLKVEGNGLFKLASRYEGWTAIALLVDVGLISLK